MKFKKAPGFLTKFLLLDLLMDKKARPAFIYAGSTILVGVVLYHWLEGWSWLDSTYFVIITLTTIGYGDLTPTTPFTKLVTIFFALNGVAILLLLINELQRVRQSAFKERMAEKDKKDEEVVSDS